MADLILWNSLNIDHAPIRPAGPHQLSYWLKLNGYSVKVIDFCSSLSTSELVDITQKNIDSKTIAIGVSNTFWSNPSKNEDFFEPNWVIKARSLLNSKKIKWLLGGCKSPVDKKTYFDWTFLEGYAEDSLLKFMDENSNTNRPAYVNFDIQKLNNIFFDDISLQSTEVLPIELSRGCQFKCKFCSYPLLGKKKNSYIRNYDLIEREFIENYEKYGITKYFFLDDTFNESFEKLTNLANIVQKLPFKLRWIGYNRLDLIGSDPRQISLLKDAGLVSSFFGIESFHPEASKIVGKGWNGVHGKEFLLKLQEEWKYDINFKLSFIVGLTGENEQSVNDTHQWCISNNMPHWGFYPLGINSSASKTWKSEFDLNHIMYGYKFPNKEMPEYWVSKLWNRESARKKAFELNNEVSNYKKVAGWLLGEISTLGYEFDFLMNENVNRLNWDELKMKNKEFLSKYVANQLM